jgi:DNA-binding NarL/FixJ family response regulator
VTPTRVAIVDTQRLVVEMTRSVLQDAGEIVVGVAYRLDEVAPLLLGVPADVALVGYALPDGRGTEAIRSIRRAWPLCRAVLFTRFLDPRIAEEAIAAGADGVVRKGHGMQELLDVVRRAAAGEVLLDPATLAGLAWHASALAAPAPVSLLSDRERDVLEVLLEEGDVDTAAVRLGITPSTYRVHLHHAMRKLGVDTRLAAISYALHAGFIRAPGARVGSESMRPAGSAGVVSAAIHAQNEGI